MMADSTPRSMRLHLEDAYEVKPGMWLNEAALWLEWIHTGELVATSSCQLLQVGATEFADVVQGFPEVSSFCALYAHAFCDMVVDTSDLFMDYPPCDVEVFCLEYMATRDRPLEVGTNRTASSDSLCRIITL